MRSTHRKKMRRRERNTLRFLTFSCYHQLPLFGRASIRDAFARRLEAARCACGFRLDAWVVMPEHVHLLLWPRNPDWPVKRLLHRLKFRFGTMVIARWKELRAPVLERIMRPDGARFWQRGGGHDRNIWSDAERLEKIAYIHNNPVRRGLVERATDWAWSSARWYAGDHSGVVQINRTHGATTHRPTSTADDRARRDG